MIHRSDVVLQVDINDPIVPSFQVLLCCLDGRVTASPWTKPLARVVKSRLVNRLKYPTRGGKDEIRPLTTGSSGESLRYCK